MQTYMFINTGVKMVFFKNAYGMKAKAHGQNLIGMMPNLLSLLMQMQTGRSPQTSACFSFPLSQLPSKIASVSKTSPACYFPSGFMWKQALEFRSAATESPEGNSRLGVLSSDNRHLKTDSHVTPHPSPNAAHTSQPYSIPSAFSPALPL